MTIDPEVKREIEELRNRVTALEHTNARARTWADEVNKRILDTQRSVIVNKAGFDANEKKIRENARLIARIGKGQRDLLVWLVKDINEIHLKMEGRILKSERRIEKLERFQSDLERRARTF